MSRRKAAVKRADLKGAGRRGPSVSEHGQIRMHGTCAEADRSNGRAEADVATYEPNTDIMDQGLYQTVLEKLDGIW